MDKKKILTNYIIAFSMLLLFVVFTILVKTVDVKAIGPENTKIGFASVNQAVRDAIGVKMVWYNITDWLGLVAIAVAGGFGVLGLYQWIKRKSFLKVDREILVLGCYYALVVSFYVFFELCIVNYRPIIMGESVEASYPSSHAMIVLSILGTAIPQFHRLIKNRPCLIVADSLAVIVMLITVIGRLISGVHWFTDIIGGLILSSALVLIYNAVIIHLNSLNSKE